MLRLILAMIVFLRPNLQESELRRMSREIDAGARTRADAELLIAVHLHETGFALNPRYPFGLTCCMRRVHRRGDAARIALEILHLGEQRCGTRAGSLRRYNSGSCREARGPSGYAANVLRTVERLRRVRP